MAHEAEHADGADARARARIEAALDERRRSFLRMVSHELRTPLNSIRARARLSAPLACSAS